ncbi:MAG: hypothetical protein KGM15_00265 [Pseudomonadota bacterium]|nr:hypothetical protein [Pseudomonadota bacterium]
MKIWIPTATVVTLAILSAELARAEEMFRPVLQAGAGETCRINGEAAGCTRFEGYIYVSPRAEGSSRDGFSFGPANPASAPVLDGRANYQHLGLAQP